jgi:raffinose/stachyose/melibiose transport system substrate-binding protein
MLAVNLGVSSRSPKEKPLKRIWTAALSLLLATAAALVATAAFARTDSSSLNIYAQSGDRIPLQAALAIWQKRQPDVKVHVTYADTNPYQSTLRTQLAAGTAADVFEVWPGNGNPAAIQVLAPYNYIADLSKQPFATREPAGIRAVTHVKGKLYVVPPALSGIGAIYNMGTLAKLRVAPPTTWSGVLSLCATARAAGIAAYALGIQDSWVAQLIPYALVTTLVYRKQPDFEQLLKAGKTSFSKSGWRTAENQYVEMNQHGCFERFPLGTNYNASLALVATSHAAGVVQGSWAFAPLRQANSRPTYKMFPFPAKNSSVAQIWMPGAANAGFAVNERTKNPEAIKFVNFVASSAFQTAFAKASGSLPAYPTSTFKVDPGLALFVKYQKSGRTYPFPDQLWPNAKVQNAHLTGLQNIFAGKESVAKMLAAMDEAYHSK